jgi:hypothetical protein
MKTIIQIFFLALFCLKAFSQQTEIKYLSGVDKDHTQKWDFYCSEGRNSGKWTTIPVPSNWELQGFGAYNYGSDKVKASEYGLYRHRFQSGSWNGKKVFIVFEGSMTDTRVMINGKQAGPLHQGSFYRFKYDITNLIKFNSTNLLEVRVDKMSANASVNDAERNRSDFWVFGGIYRPVYLEIEPEVYIDRLAVNASADGSFQIDVFTRNVGAQSLVEAQVQKLSGENVGKPFSIPVKTAGERLQLKSNFIKPSLWSAEYPNLYQVVVSIRDSHGINHRVRQKFGFRTVEVRPHDGLYVNGSKTILKGTCRHSFWPESGRTLSKKLQVLDVNLMKEMNNNAVRMSHYPPDQEFLDVCDSLGLYVLDELTGWQAKYDTLAGRKLLKEMVFRDVNHPSILFWDNGNEGGWNTLLDSDYALYDPQKRMVLHPWSLFNDVDTHHYPDFNYLKKVTAGSDVFMPTEFMHGLYDGGGGAALEDFWEEMMKYPHTAGGFIWAFVDESVVRTDKKNSFDGDGNHAPDGILGPHREKEASFYAVKELWSPVYVNARGSNRKFDGKVEVQNRYTFTRLSQCKFKWQLLNFPSADSRSVQAENVLQGNPLPLELAPGEKGVLDLHLPANWKKYDAVYLTAYGPHQEELFTWSWSIRKPAAPARSVVSASPAKIAFSVDDRRLIVKCDGIEYFFDKVTGYIDKVKKANATISLSGGPVLAGVDATLKSLSYKAAGSRYIVDASYEGNAPLSIRWTFTPGHPVQLDYSFIQTGDVDYMGITFNYPEDKITGMKWLGRGPFRTWKNRQAGQKLGVWYKKYNDGITGEQWQYPEFKGYHGEVQWAVIENKESPFTVYTDSQNLFLQMYKPSREQDAMKNNNVEPAFPEGNIGFLNAISPIGTKFQSPMALGPQSQKTQANGQPVKGRLWFIF